MRLLHLADLHLGKTVNGFSQTDDQRHILHEALRIAQDESVDAILLAGDLYDRSSPSAEAVSLLDGFLTRAADLGIAVLAIPGNHDSAERVAYAAGPLSRQGIYLAPAFDGSVRRVVLEDEHGPVAFWLLPFLKPASVRCFFPEADIGQDYTAALRTVLASCALDAAQRNVLLCHQFVTVGGAAPDRTDSELSLGGLDNVDASVFDAFDYVALGHVHRPQRVGRDQVRYAGSPLKYSLSEARDRKSAVLVDLGPKREGERCAVRIELAPLEPLRDLRRITGPLAELVSDEVMRSADANDYIHAVLTDATPVIDALARLRAAYPNVMSMEYAAQSRAADTSPAPDRGEAPQESPFELFERFFEERNGFPLTTRQAQRVRHVLEYAEEDA